jgi:hypothetical protein
MRYLKSFQIFENNDELLYHEIDSSVDLDKNNVSISKSDMDFIQDLIRLILLKQEASSVVAGKEVISNKYYKFAEQSPFYTYGSFIKCSIIWNRITSTNDIKSYSAAKKNSINISKDNDDYYTLQYIVSESTGMKIYTYKCDQLEGLNQCLNFVLNNK